MTKAKAKAETMHVKPRPGVQLAGIPAIGATVATELAEEWLAAELVEEIEPFEGIQAGGAPAIAPAHEPPATSEPEV